MQGITWGLVENERAMNDLLTIQQDVAFKLSIPRFFVELTPDAMMSLDERTSKPEALNLNTDEVRQIHGRLRHTLENVDTPNHINSYLQMLMGLWQRSGLNPIAMGESPGSDPAGYTVNTLQGAAQSQYEVLLDNAARTWGQVCDFTRSLIKYTLHEGIYLSAPSGAEKRETTFLLLAPEDVDDTPCQVRIDPLSDANRMAQRQSLMDGMAAHVVPREVVMRDGYGATNPSAWDRSMLLDDMKQQLSGFAVQLAMYFLQQRLQSAMPQPAADPMAALMGGGAGGGMGLPPGGGGMAPTGGGPNMPPGMTGMNAQQQMGGQPANLQPPTNPGASGVPNRQPGGAMNYQSAMAGQGQQRQLARVA
jgi:hypothetical protein